MELETINKLYLELSQIATAKTAKEMALEKDVLPRDAVTVAHVLLHDPDLGWPVISSGLHQDFRGGPSGFNIRYSDGSEYRVSFKITEIEPAPPESANA